MADTDIADAISDLGSSVTKVAEAIESLADREGPFEGIKQVISGSDTTWVNDKLKDGWTLLAVSGIADDGYPLYILGSRARQR